MLTRKAKVVTNGILKLNFVLMLRAAFLNQRVATRQLVMKDFQWVEEIFEIKLKFSFNCPNQKVKEQFISPKC